LVKDYGDKKKVLKNIANRKTHYSTKAKMHRLHQIKCITNVKLQYKIKFKKNSKRISIQTTLFT
jgi:hypothetical protein